MNQITARPVSPDLGHAVSRTVIEVDVCLVGFHAVPAGSERMMDFLMAVAEIHSAMKTLVGMSPGPGSFFDVDEDAVPADQPHAVVRAYLEALKKNLELLSTRDVTENVYDGLSMLSDAVSEVRRGIAQHLPA